MSLLILSDRNEVLQRAILAGSEEAKKEAWNSIATEGALGAAAAVGLHGRAVPRLTYEAASYHGKVDTVTKSRAPTNGQDALNTPVQVKQTSTRWIGIDYKTREFVVFDETKNSVYHGHVRSWKNLHPDMQNALTRAGMVNRNGKILIDGEKKRNMCPKVFSTHVRRRCASIG